MLLSPFFELVNVFWQGSMPCFGHIAVVFPGTGPQISQRRDFADEIFDLCFSLQWSFLFPDTQMT